ncbi:uncharacterized protein LOC130629951 [Hydractinia symbiolongicarpus]|uniref:uncharacterized protein LOC130629951 n=1 Tax=Hydractinia symbiolongicarpus TaxID=13093 RepID=UPI00254BA8EE|nr:uncharacterized protein LOC130629951 [Hydractinia symbiolongicarpus]
MLPKICYQTIVKKTKNNIGKKKIRITLSKSTIIFGFRIKNKKVHRLWEFDQSPWLKRYIDFNEQKKLFVFGKTMEYIRKRVNVELVTNKVKLMKLTSKPTFESSKIFNEDLVAVHRIKETLTLNRPAYVGMYTDSLTYEITTDDGYMDFWNDKDKFDNSDYRETSQFYNTSNKKIFGKMKDEAADVPIVEFVGLKSKMYGYMTKNVVKLPKVLKRT